MSSVFKKLQKKNIQSHNKMYLDEAERPAKMMKVEEEAVSSK
jgi:ribosome biogenesis protein BRX1